ncbi:glutamate-5-semialdehyde dehydrogenase [candidate division WOR-1 bacterium RIFOXYD2_FULL_36_8]|uniref:Gamma-glutamyl phosphate reductase n=1 Tax=candidate division WOR-1 bacterium RIFOXYB2_FULL_36_35 TaxID=1802578 RepID=A0A1F4S5P5_UNCSA|nr:MAG: glutamate-5-semialdehyde dehydrogenase [candidate division WOR-1 bacterium RIFOXYA2_FULL_36_21]OGC15719.1 MAG: glutamate-5-semialdehyde dehydrogenase [candidate division WOR-1 bacterium RIFOXYB2_FULL_36_35]OGC21074.1 MAG: glutamate-5-semialdehyde dehydrogenase [candidate division WOR-1 bacterium RIFOXYA12_FULL_36_13]OGC41254.1 MAG: glutamate-5-semialdehyde dehydrogenase [candidate division WOR-1 bacterium RIFOXYD2_FULL_36_8]
MTEILDKCKKAKAAAIKLGNISTEIKNKALDAMADALGENSKNIIDANKKDLRAGEKKGLSLALLDRLMLNEKRILGIIDSLDVVKKLKDPVFEVISEWTRPNGLRIQKRRVPLGVIGIIYEARPNVTVDSASLCMKSGNATVLRGGSDAINSNKILAEIISCAAYKVGIPDGSICLIEDTSRKSSEELMGMRGYLDVLIPRGGKNLIQTVIQKAKVPTIETGEGNCHAYVEKTADLKMALEIVYNSKVSRPSVCNAIETLLVDEEIAAKFLPMIFSELKEANVEVRGDKKVLAIDSSIKKATDEDWTTEFLSLILAVKVVKDYKEAVDHINRYGTKHSETIITKDKEAENYFLSYVDASSVYVNASTRFTDGGEFGFGSEIGISTQKLHARGPMGLPELTSYKYVVYGDGQIR